jgi:hypothetical protein
VKVPAEFVPQNPEVANPPSFLLVLNRMLDGGDGQDLALLDVLWPRLTVRPESGFDLIVTKQ